MASLLSRFRRDERAALSQRWAVFAGGLGVVCVVCTHLIDAGLRNGTIPTILVRSGVLPARPQTSEVPSSNPVKEAAAGIDYEGTASIPSAQTISRVDPCTNPMKR